MADEPQPLPPIVVPGPPVPRKKKPQQLSIQQEKFLAAYARHGDVRRAMTSAGYRKTYPSRYLLNISAVKLRLDRIRQRLQSQADTVLPKDAILRELASISLSDIGQYYREDGSPVPLNELPQDARAAVQEYRVSKAGTSVKLYDKLTGLELAMRHLGLLEVQTGSGLTVQINVGSLQPGNLDPVLSAKVVTPSGNPAEVEPQLTDR